MKSTQRISRVLAASPFDVSDPREDLDMVWRVARQTALMAYRDWCQAPYEQRRTAYAVYRAAEEQEAAAAEHMRLRVLEGVSASDHAAL
jgi:hypothetical protein